MLEKSSEVAARPSWQLPFWVSFWIGCRRFAWFPSDFAYCFDWLVTIRLRLPRTLRGNLCVGAHSGKVVAGRLWELHVFVQFVHSPVTIWLKLLRALRGNFRFGCHFG